MVRCVPIHQNYIKVLVKKINSLYIIYFLTWVVHRWETMVHTYLTFLWGTCLFFYDEDNDDDYDIDDDNDNN